MLPYGRQTIEQDDIDAVIDALKSDFLTTGPLIEQFEQKLCDITKAKYAVACSNGTTALHLACMAIGLQKGDYAIVPSLTFLATANAVRYCGADVIFCDVDRETGLMTAETLEQALSKAQEQNLTVKAILPVHLTGRPVDMQTIQSIAQEHGIKIITDACHAIGGTYQNQPIGSGHFEDMAAFSFHPVKTIAMGEGGAITTNNKAFADHMRTLRHHAMSPKDNGGVWEYEMKELGYNYRVTDMQCALGLSQLNKIENFINKRQELVTLYNQKLENLSSFITPHKQENDNQVSWHLYTIQVDFDGLGTTRSEFMAQLKEQGVGTQVHYTPVHTQPYYEDLYDKQELPGATHYYTHTLSLPLYPLMEEQDVNIVIKALKVICEGK